VEICPFSQSLEKFFLYLKVSTIPHRVPATIKKRSTATAIAVTATTAAAAVTSHFSSN
jgi:hypothetical protein